MMSLTIINYISQFIYSFYNMQKITSDILD